MATPFTDVFCMNDKIKNDNRLKGLPTNLYYAIQFAYLEYAISYFVYDCYKDLTDYVPFSQTEYNFSSDGVDKEYLLSPPPATGALFYVGYRANKNLAFTETLNFTFDSITNVLTINDTIPNGYEVYVSAYIIGQFNATLNISERVILANGMNVPYSQEMEFTTFLQSQMVYGAGEKMYSQSQHLREVRDTANSQYYTIVKGMISEYTYRTPSSLSGLGGIP